MKKLYLIRHAKSSWKHPDLLDIDRPLNKRGKRDASFMGKRLKHMKIYPELIMSSPARRAKKTAKMLASELDYPKAKIRIQPDIYHGSVMDMVSVIHKIDDDYKQIFLIGHNPYITELANFLTGSRIDNMPTCGIAGILFDLNRWKEIEEGKGRLEFFDYPKKHFLDPQKDSSLI